MLIKFHAHTQHHGQSDIIEFSMDLAEGCDPKQALAEAREAVEHQPELDMRNDDLKITKIELASEYDEYRNKARQA